MSNRPHIPAKDVTGNSDVFTNFTRKLIKVPHSDIQEKLDAERKAKRTPKNVSRVSAAPSKVR